MGLHQSSSTRVLATYSKFEECVRILTYSILAVIAYAFDSF